MSGTCSAAGSTTTIVDTSADSPIQPSSNATLYDSAWAKIEADSAGTPLNVGEVRRIKPSGTTPTTGTVTVDMAYTNATTTTQQYGLYFMVPPTRVEGIKGLDEYINDFLRSRFYTTDYLLTLVTDGDMESTTAIVGNVLGGWTRSSSNITTFSKNTTAAYVFRGARSLHLVNSVSATNYVRSELVPVAEGQVMHVVADVRVISGTAKLYLYDETNSAEIDSATTTQLRKGYLYLTSTVIPSGCNEVSVRLGFGTATTEVYWDTVSLRNSRTLEYDLPSWLVDPDWLREVFYTYGGTIESAGGDSLTAAERDEHLMHDWGIREEPTAATPYRVWHTGMPPASSHLWLRARRPYGELSADTDTTTADQDWVRANVVAAVLEANGKEKEAAKARLIAHAYNQRFARRPTVRAYRALRGF